MTNIYSLTTSEHQAKLIYLPVPWEATTSYGGGTSNGPDAILKASMQIDLFDSELGNISKAGLYMLPESRQIREFNEQAKNTVNINEINALSHKVNEWVYQESTRILNENKYVAIVGGDHSVPYGAIKSLCHKHESFGILHLDAHMDLRRQYQGYTHSHASIFYNVLTDLPQVTKLTQVGIRDFCEEELVFGQSQGDRVSVFFDNDTAGRLLCGETWDIICDDIITTLPSHVYLSFDIDGLDPQFCPNTGTPVPGGLTFHQANYLIKKLVKSGRTLIGFDLCEVSPSYDPKNEWDGNVAMRLLYKLSGWILESGN